MKTVILSFDYEVFGRVPGNVQSSVIEPTDRILKLFSHYNKKGTFFIDLLYFFSFPNKIVNDQIKRIFNSGHEIGVHIHPHWINGEVSIFKSDIKKCFEIWFAMKDKIIPDCSPVSYRGGALMVQPFSELKPYFEQYGLIIDSSVAKGLYINSSVQHIDFRNAPSKSIYAFTDDPLTESNGALLEVPITTYKQNIIENLGSEKNTIPKFGDGIGFGFNDIHGDKSWLQRKKIILRNFLSSYRMYTLENVIPEFSWLKLKLDSRKNICFISHPKSMDENSLYYLGYLLKNHSVTTLKNYAGSRL